MRILGFQNSSKQTNYNSAVNTGAIIQVITWKRKALKILRNFK